jgi:hypothetical protein
LKDTLNKLVLLASLAAAGPTLAADARCDAATLGQVARFLKLKSLVYQDQQADGDAGSASKAAVLAAGVCKSWPYRPNIMLTALAYTPPVGASDTSKQLLVAMVDRQAGQVVGSYRSFIDEDGATEVGPNSLSLDTAAYQLAPDQRAFGVRFSSSARGPSCADAGSYNTLTLLLPQGATLRRLLELDMVQQQAVAGCLGSATGHNVIDNAELTLAVAPTTSKGLADLVATARITRYSEATEKEAAPRTERVQLKYDGSGYAKGDKWWLGYH